MIYAPVAIPTLCRFEHFKACIESLSRCTWAEHTEVFVGLDYPAKESHWEGYRKINDYLDHAGDMGFKKLHVIKRDPNYGLDYVKRDPNQIGNTAALVKEIAQSFSCYIYSEDDNVFSPNFLEYIDKGLEKFKDDDKVVAVVGYCHPYAFKHATTTTSTIRLTSPLGATVHGSRSSRECQPRLKLVSCTARSPLRTC